MTDSADRIRLGLLDTIPAALYLPGQKTDPQKFIDMFDAAGASFDYVVYRAAEGEWPADLDECDAYLITGSPCSVYEDLPWIADLERFVRDAFEAGKPQVGICFGHQVAAKALGGKVEKADSGWTLGRHELLLKETRPWMMPQQSRYRLHYINQDQVIELPPGVDWLAEAPGCPKAMFAVDARLLCIQPHPEQPLASMQAFIEHLAEGGAIDDATREAAEASFDDDPPDATVVAQWIARFLTEAAARVRQEQ